MNQEIYTCLHINIFEDERLITTYVYAPQESKKQTCRLERFLPDLMHAGLLGSAKCHNGSVLTFLIEASCFGDLGPGEYEQVMKGRLREAYRHFRSWCRDNNIRVVQPRFTPARLHRKSRASYPALSQKAIPGKAISFWLAAVSREWASRPEATLLDKAVEVCAFSYAAMLRKLDVYPFVMSPEQAQDVHDTGVLHLQTYAYLRAASSQVRRGQNKCLWLMLPKHHHIQKMLRTLAAECVNPNWYSLMTAESFVGLIGKLTRTAHRTTVTLRGLQRYLCILKIRTSEIT